MAHTQVDDLFESAPSLSQTEISFLISSNKWLGEFKSLDIKGDSKYFSVNSKAALDISLNKILFYASYSSFF